MKSFHVQILFQAVTEGYSNHCALKHNADAILAQLN